MNTRMVITVVILLTIFAVNASLAQNRITFENLQLLESQTISLDVLLVNSDTVEGIQIPITYSNTTDGISCDSVSFSGSSCAFYDVKQAELFNEQNSLYIRGICNTNIDSDNTPLLPGTNFICNIYFSLSDTTQDFNFAVALGHLGKGKLTRELNLWTPDATEVSSEVIRFEQNIIR